MTMLRLKPPPWALLVGLPVFLTQLTPSVLSSDPGTPLTKEEYKIFFFSQKPMWKASLVCQIRHSKGCFDHSIMQLDQFENHGQIPEGPICTNLQDGTRFENFCQFAQFRCLNHKYYAKRIPCPEPPPVEEVVLVSLTTFNTPSNTPATSTSEISPSPEMRLHSNIDAILKYAFAVSGEEPVTKKPESKWKTIHTTTTTTTTTTEQNQAVPSTIQLVTVSAETVVSDIKPVKGTTGLTDQKIHQSINRLIGKAFSLEQSLSADNMKTTQSTKTDQEEALETTPKGSILALDKNAALVILCYSVLQDICVATAVSKAWRQMESKTSGFGDSVCDSSGRRHTDLCPECAFCSLKIEQCQGAADLKRVSCEDGTFTDYINPGILAQHQAMVPRVSSDETEFYEIEAYGGLQTEYWCGRLATHGCDDYRVALWLQSEYSSFKGGDFPNLICDSEEVQHPTYCAFKSNQCQEYSLNKNKVFRVGCFKNETYNVLTEEEGEEEVQRWNEKFSDVAKL
ncbi:acrosin-binding protein isoform X3 [Sceloporus undulatus]|uniref:acrosin-binding protein isoform X3 n=1 Tax=Sceloporus undulatus TaxID=8520 RepID=UPI001C4BCDF8|nr:acrosin-binding protein isoform X3 [Sceloporus undulatus]